MAEEQIVTNIVAKSDFSNLITDLNKVSSALTGLQDKLQATNKTLAAQVAVMNRSFAETMRSTGQFSTHFVSLSSDVEKFGSQLDKGQMKLGKFFQTYSQHVKSNGGLIRDLAKQQVQLQNSVLQPLGRNAEGMMQYNVHIPRGLDVVKNKTAIAKQELMIMNKVIQEGAGQLINWGKNTQWAGRQLTVGLTVPLLAFGKAASDAFKNADQQLVRLTKVYGGIAAVSSQELGKVRQDVIKTANEISKAYGSSFTETIALAADIAATGKQGNELLGSIRETTRLAVLGEVDRQDAMKATLAIQTAFKQNTEELSESINFLNAVENQTSTTLNDLVEAIPKAGPIVKGLGGDVKDLALYLTAMREGGISASEGANALKSGLASLINPTKVAKGMFDGFGISLTDIVQRNAGDTTATILELQSALETLNPLQKQQALEQLFGKFQFARMNALFENLGKQGSQTLQVLDLMKASSQELGNLADRELAQVTESASGKYRRAIEGLKADLAGVGEQFLKINTSLIKFVNGILDFVQALPNPIKQALGFIGMITAASGPLIMLTGVLANFFGYIIKGASHFRSFFKGGEGWKLLTPEILAAQKAGNLVEQTFYSDAKAAAVLKQAISSLSAEFVTLEQRAMSAAVAVNPAVSTVGGTAIMAGSVNSSHPLVGKPGTRAAAHHNPRSGMSQAQRDSQTIHSVTPAPIPVNQKIGAVPQIFMQGGLPAIEGLTTSKGISTGIVAQEAAKWHALMGSLSMLSKTEVATLKKEIIKTGAFSQDISNTFGQLLIPMTDITTNAATRSAQIVAQLQSGKITMESARAKIIALNAEIERMMAVATTQLATSLGRTANLTQVPLINQPIVSNTGKSNIKEIFRPNRGASGILDKIAKSLGVRTWGGGYSTETTIPKKFAGGITALGLKLPKFTNPLMARGASKLLRAFSEQSGRIGGSRVPSAGQAKSYVAAQKGERVTSSGRGMSTAAHVEEGAGKTFREFSKREGDLYKDPEIIRYGITPTRPGLKDDNQVLVHGAGKAFRNRTKNLTTLPGQSAPMIPGNQLSSLNLTGKTNKPYVQLLPTQFVKNREGFNKKLNKGIATSADWAPVTGDDMVSLKYFLKEQGVNVQSANRIAARAADVLNDKIANAKGPITENIFGDILNQASIRGMRSIFHPIMRQSSASASSKDPFWGRGNLEPMPFRNGVSQLPGYGGGDIVPALLEPGESVVTKTATYGNQNAITLMNQGYPIDRMLGFKNGVTGVGMPVQMYANGVTSAFTSGLKNPYGKSMLTNRQMPKMGTGASLGIGMGGMAAGSMIGGGAGQAVMIASSMASMIPMFAGLSQGVGIVTKLASVLGKLTIPGAFIGALLGVGKVLLDLKKNYEDVGKANRLAFGGTKESFASVGITKFKTLSDRIKEVNEQIELNKVKAQSAYEQYTKNGPTGITLSIAELNEAIENAKKNQTDYIEAFNKIDSSGVNKYAADLKAQFVAMGLSASEASNQIFAMIKASEKASQAFSAVTTSDFKNIIDQSSALSRLFNNLSKASTVDNFNPEEFAQGLDTLINSVLAYQEGLIGTIDAADPKNIIDSAESLRITMEKITKINGKNNDLSVDQVNKLKEQNIIYASILGKGESLASITAKILLYNSELSSTIDLSKMSGQEAIDLTSNLATIQNGLNQITEGTGKDNPLSFLAESISKAKTATNGYAQSIKNAQKQDADYYKNKIKAIDLEIKKINEAANARKKALQEQQDSESFSTEIKKKQLEYQDALAAGDMSRAAQAQLDIQQLTKEKQMKSAIAAIDAKQEADVKIKEAQKQKELDAEDKFNKGVQTSMAKSAETTANLAKLTNIRDEIERLTILARTPGADKKGIQKQVAEILTGLKSGTADEKKMYSKYEKEYGYTGQAYNQNNPLSMAGNLLAAMNSSMSSKGMSDSIFQSAVTKFDAAVTKFSGQTGPKSVTKDYGNFVDALNPLTWKNKDNLKNLMKAEGLKEGDKFTYKGKTYNIDDDSGMGIVSVVKKAIGGYVSGPGTGTSDSIPAMLSSGEYIIKEKAVNKYGVPFFDNLNAQKFAMGGLASSKEKGVPSAKIMSQVESWKESNKQIVKIEVPPITANFATNSYELSKEQKLELQAIAKDLVKHKLNSLVIQGHTDSVGKSKDNEVLSQNRAKAIAQYLSQLVPNTGFIPVGYGEYSPVAPNTNAANMAKNRRAEFILPDKYKTIYPEFNPKNHEAMLSGQKMEWSTGQMAASTIDWGKLFNKIKSGIGFNEGGAVRGAGSSISDSIPAMLSNGEYVINADSVKKYGVQTFEAFNNKKYAMGGYVQRMPYAQGGIAKSANSLYNINVTLNGSDLDANDVARAIHREMKMREITAGRSRTV
jgi:TP901 family phage tail tape measure protein